MPWHTLRIAIIYGPVWLTIIVTFAIYLRVGLYIYLQLKQLRAVEMCGDWIEDVNYITDTSATEMRPMPSHQYPHNSQVDQSRILRQQSISVRFINRHSDASGLVRAHSNSTTVGWAYTRYSLLFFIALLVTWVCYSFVHCQLEANDIL